jgi:hypothetical protein
MNDTAFFFSHSNQIKWYTAFASAFREIKKGNKVVLFVHGEVDKECAMQFDCYDEVIDIIEGFDMSYLHPIDRTTRIDNIILELEKAIGENILWDSLKIDRWARATENTGFVINYINHCSTLIFGLIDKHRPVFGLGENTMAIYRLAYYKMKSLDIKYLSPIGTRYYERFYIEDSLDWLWEDAINLYEKFSIKLPKGECHDQAAITFDNITKKNAKPGAFEAFKGKQSIGYVPIWKMPFISILKKIIYHIQKGKKLVQENNIRSLLEESSFHKKLYRFLWNLYSHFKYSRLVLKKIPKDINYSTYFIHYQPEYTVDSLGRFYADQEFLIVNIASGLPSDQYLIVKDHPTMVGLRPPRFYEHIKKNKNVLLVHHSINSSELISNSTIVFTIVGTAAIEAMFLGVPAIMFGKYAFANTNLISCCTNFWDLPGLINRKMFEKLDQVVVSKHAIALLAAKYNGSFPGKIPANADEIDTFYNDRKNYNLVKKSFRNYLIDRILQDEL